MAAKRFAGRVGISARPFKVIDVFPPLHLLCRSSGNHAAGDPIPRITRGIGDIVVSRCLMAIALRCESNIDVSAYRHIFHERFITSDSVFVYQSGDHPYELSVFLLFDGLLFIFSQTEALTCEQFNLLRARHPAVLS
jgi:hypothetical protein